MARILIAEDDVTLSESLAEIFEIQGHEIKVVYDGRKAWDALQHQHFDVLVTDYLMPTWDAMSLLEHIESQAVDFKHLRIVVISGYEVQHLESHPRINALLRKPFDLQDIFDVIDSTGH